MLKLLKTKRHRASKTVSSSSTKILENWKSIIKYNVFCDKYDFMKKSKSKVNILTITIKKKKERNSIRYLCNQKRNLKIKKIVKNMVGFILLDTDTFQTIENTFLNNITEDLPTKSKLIEILNNFSKMIQKEIKQLLLISSCNCLSFDEWSDLKNRKFLGITIRSLIDGMYCDFF